MCYYAVLFYVLCTLFKAVKTGNSTNPYAEALKLHPWESIQKYVEVRPGAHIFYWLYYADGSVEDAETKPLLIWIQGGPGLAASGVGNFAEIGPLDMNMKPRSHTWVKGRNVLLIDHPVGTGFSYVTNSTLLVTSDREMAFDLAKAIKIFYRNHKNFRKTPTYILGQSYGGKITARLSYYLHLAICRNNLKMNFKGIGIGSAWISPRESAAAEIEYLYMMGVIDRKVYTSTRNMFQKLRFHIDNKNYNVVPAQWDLITSYLYQGTGFDLNYNNINQESPFPALRALDEKVNKYVKPTLPMVNQSLEWHFDSEKVFYKLEKSFLSPATKFLEKLLNGTTIKIAIYNGNLDVLTPLAGASNWAHKLKWQGADAFYNANKHKIRGDKNGFYKTTKQLSFWWVFGSGHWVPEDNPTAMHHILDYLTDVTPVTPS